MNLDPTVVSEVFGITAAPQRFFDKYQKPEKLEAKKRAAELLRARVAGGRMLDVGGENFYHRYFGSFEIQTHNLPERDMHEMAYRQEFDAVVAMHVLEHSPFPLLVLRLIHRALKPGGWLYVAVPRPCDKFCSDGYGHWSVMRATMWNTLLVGAGFRVDAHESGKFGDRRKWVEQRFICQAVA